MARNIVKRKSALVEGLKKREERRRRRALGYKKPTLGQRIKKSIQNIRKKKAKPVFGTSTKTGKKVKLDF